MDDKMNKAAEEAALKEEDEGYRITRRAISVLKTVYDPEIPVNVYDLGLIYRIDFTPDDRILLSGGRLHPGGCKAEALGHRRPEGGGSAAGV